MKDELVRILGKEACLFDMEDRAAYAFDAGHDRGGVPMAVVLAGSARDVAALMAFSRVHQIPVIPRGAGSGLTGGAVPFSNSIVLSMARMNRILEIDTENLCAVVQPGVVTGQLQAKIREKGLFYPPDPASQDFCTIGGNIAENAGGMRAVKYGVTKNYVMGLEVVLPCGDIIQLGSKCIKDVAGYSMTELFVGSEGTLGVITRATVKLMPLPQKIITLAVCFDSIHKAGRAVPKLMQSGIIPCTLEFIDETCLRAVRGSGLMKGCESFVNGNAKAMLLVEVDGRSQQVVEDAKAVKSVCRELGMLSLGEAHSPEERERLWHVRRSIHGALGTLCTQWMEEDISVPRASIPDMLDRLAALSRKESLIIPCFGHYGDGNIHLGVAGTNGPLTPDRAEEIRTKIFIMTVELGGRIAAEHGIGLSKRTHLGQNLTNQTLEFAGRLKKMLDPDNLLNPGKAL